MNNRSLSSLVMAITLVSAVGIEAGCKNGRCSLYRRAVVSRTEIPKRPVLKKGTKATKVAKANTKKVRFAQVEAAEAQLGTQEQNQTGQEKLDTAAKAVEGTETQASVLLQTPSKDDSASQDRETKKGLWHSLTGRFAYAWQRVKSLAR